MRKIKKKGKKIQYTRLKKPSFGKVFRKKLIRIFTILGILCLVGSRVAYEVLLDKEKKDFEYYCQSQSDSIDKETSKLMKKNIDGILTEKESLEQWKNAIEFKMLTGNALGFACAVYELDLKEVIVKTRDRSCVLVPDKTKDYTYKYVDTHETLNQVYEEAALLEKEDKKQEWYYRMTVEEVYVKDGEFVPGKVVISRIQREGVYEDEEEAEEAREGEIIKEYDFTPDNKEKYQLCREIKGPFYVLNDIKNTETLQWLENWVDERKKESQGKIEGYSKMHTSEGLLKGKFINMEVVGEEFGEDMEVWLCIAKNYNLLESYGKTALIVYVGLVFIGLIIALLTAYRTFLKLQAQYQIDEYRRNTTNTMAHDLKSPLMAISGYAENLKSAVHEEKREYYENAILENVGYMNEIIAKTLELAKIEDAGYQLSYCSVDLLELTHELKKKYEPLAEDRGLEWEIEGNCIIQADKTAMTQVVENLLSNVVKYAAEGSLISIQMTEKAYEIRNGMSQMIEGDIEELWKPFVKGDNSRSGKKGTGIGLTIVKNILDAHQFELNLSQEDNEFVVRVDF